MLFDLGGLLGGIIGGGMNALSQHSANKTNIRLMQESNAWNERLMREAWARDDKAVQRRVADLQAAGLHPSLASGGGQASSPIHVGTAQVDSVRSGDIALQAIQGALAQSQISHTEAQNEYLKQQSRGQELQNKITEKKLNLGMTEEEIRALSTSTNIKEKQEQRDQARHDFNMSADRYDLDIYKELNLPRGTPLGLIQKLETFLGFLSRLIEGRDRGLIESVTDTALDISQSAMRKATQFTFDVMNQVTGGDLTIQQFEDLTEQWIEEIQNGRTPNGFERLFMGQELQNRGITPTTQQPQTNQRNTGNMR